MGSETHVGRLLREAREGRFKGRKTGLRQIEALLGISRPTLNHWETGFTKTIPVAQAVALAVEFEIPLEVLREAALADATELRDAQRGLAASPNGAGAPRPTAEERAAWMAEGSASTERRKRDRRKRQPRKDEAPDA